MAVTSLLLTEVNPDLQVKVLEPRSMVLERRFASELGQVLSPTQVRAFLDCSAKWWFRYGLHLPEPKTSSLALGSALHRALEVNFREKISTGHDLETPGVLALFRDAWIDQVPETEFREDESPKALSKVGEELVRKYMDEASAHDSTGRG